MRLLVGGDASCNRFSGGYELSGTTLALGEVAATRRMCSETLNDQELRVLQVLSRVARWRIENGLLLLLDAAGTEVVRASVRLIRVAHDYFSRPIPDYAAPKSSGKNSSTLITG